MPASKATTQNVPNQVLLILTINGGSSSIKFALLSADTSQVAVRIIPTDEEITIARIACSILKLRLPA